MINPYIIILSAFGIAGIGVTLWGWTIIARARKTLRWPRVEGIIQESRPATEADDLLPHIRYEYRVGDQAYSCTLEIPGSVTPSQQFTTRYLDKYPPGKKVQVYYDPVQPDHAMLEPGIGSDWMIFVLGLLATLFAVAALFFSM
jgi:Protein of unknown function (DUF3592)